MPAVSVTMQALNETADALGAVDGAVLGGAEVGVVLGGAEVGDGLAAPPPQAARTIDAAPRRATSRDVVRKVFPPRSLGTRAGMVSCGRSPRERDGCALGRSRVAAPCGLN
jgi:hypothetical protein